MSTVHVDGEREFSRLASHVRRIAQRALKLCVDGDVELAVRLMGDDEMRALNGHFRGKDTTTDVLSFDGEGPHLGDVAICVPVAMRQAVALGHGVDTELSVLTVHAVMHLCGLDHERSVDEARLQAELEMGVLDMLGVPAEAALARRGL